MMNEGTGKKETPKESIESIMEILHKEIDRCNDSLSKLIEKLQPILATEPNLKDTTGYESMCSSEIAKRLEADITAIIVITNVIINLREFIELRD